MINDPEVSPNDLGIYVRVMHMMELFYGPHDLDEMVKQVTDGHMGQRADGNEAAVRSAVQRLADAGHLAITLIEP
ncbi:hypothetical protein [Streptomyces wedmorensis]